MNQTKICTKCKIEKELTEFSKQQCQKNGVTTQCKLCHSADPNKYVPRPRITIFSTKLDHKICSKCHVEKNINEFHKLNSSSDGLSFQCAECAIAYQIKYRKEYQDKIKKWGKEYNKNNKDKISVKSKVYRENNAGNIAIKQKIYYEKNKEILSQKSKEYHKKNKEQIAMQRAEYRANPENKLKIKISKQRRRVIEKNAVGSHTVKEILELFEKQKHMCVYCKCKLSKSGKNKYNIDHWIALSKGGSNKISNIQLLCYICNVRKHAQAPEVFAQKYGMLC